MSLRTQHFDDGIVRDDGTIRCDIDSCSIEENDEILVIIPPNEEHPDFFYKFECLDMEKELPSGKAVRGQFRPNDGDEGEFALVHPTLERSNRPF